MLLGRGAGHGHEPVGVVGGAVRHRPLLHAVRDRVHDGRVERLVTVDRPPQLPEDGLGEVLALRVLVEHVLAVDGLAGVLQVVLRGSDLVGGDRSDGRGDVRSCDSCRATSFLAVVGVGSERPRQANGPASAVPACPARRRVG